MKYYKNTVFKDGGQIKRTPEEQKEHRKNKWKDARKYFVDWKEQRKYKYDKEN